MYSVTQIRTELKVQRIVAVVTFYESDFFVRLFQKNEVTVIHMGTFHSIINEDGVIGGSLAKKRYPVITNVFTVDKICFAHNNFRPDNGYCGMKY